MNLAVEKVGTFPTFDIDPTGRRRAAESGERPHFFGVPGVWRGRELAAQRALPTGFRELDALCPGGGLPVGAVTELLCERYGIGEFGLLMPAIARLTAEGRRVALVAPPWLPFAQGLAEEGVRLRQLVLLNPGRSGDALWAAEQTLRSGSVDLVIAWPSRANDRDLRRLQLAAETGKSTAVLYRPLREAAQPSPAALRIGVSSGLTGLKLDILKNRGGQPAKIFLSSRFRQTAEKGDCPMADCPPFLRPTGTGWV